MATLEDTTRPCACETRRAIIAALFTAGAAGPAIADALFTTAPSIPIPYQSDISLRLIQRVIDCSTIEPFACIGWLAATRE